MIVFLHKSSSILFKCKFTELKFLNRWAWILAHLCYDQRVPQARPFPEARTFPRVLRAAQKSKIRLARSSVPRSSLSTSNMAPYCCHLRREKRWSPHTVDETKEGADKQTNKKKCTFPSLLRNPFFKVEGGVPTEDEKSIAEQILSFYLLWAVYL